MTKDERQRLRTMEGQHFGAQTCRSIWYDTRGAGAAVQALVPLLDALDAAEARAEKADADAAAMRVRADRAELDAAGAHDVLGQCVDAVTTMAPDSEWTREICERVEAFQADPVAAGRALLDEVERLRADYSTRLHDLHDARRAHDDVCIEADDLRARIGLLEARRAEVCKACDASGRVCPHCGRGRPEAIGGMRYPPTYRCCGGARERDERFGVPCSACGGSGAVMAEGGGE